MSTDLNRYLNDRGIKDAEFAILIERDRSMVSKLRRGLVRPTLDLAAAIERASNGEVSLRSWLAAEDGVDSLPSEAAA